MTALVSPRGRPRSVAADRAILGAAEALLGEVGYADMTMAGVAARAGVSTATLYRRYASKAELTVAAIESMKDPPADIDTGSLAADLRALLSRVAETMSGDRASVFLGLAGELLRDPELANVVRERLTRPMNDRVLRMLEAAVARGEIPAPVDPEAVLSILLGPSHYRLFVTGEPLDGAAIDALVPLLVRALS